MSFHHIPHVETTLRELNRILKPNGVIIFREHDLYCDFLSVVLNVLRELYDQVWSTVPIYSHWAHYRRRKEWHQMLKLAGFTPCENSPDLEARYMHPLPVWKFQADRPIRNPYACYYGMYQKNVAEKRQRLG